MQSVINAFQSILKCHGTPSIEGSFDEQFALKRFAKKFEIPDSSAAAARKLKTFENWVVYDESLRTVVLPHGNWYRARLVIQKIIKDFQLGELTFTQGSQSEPLRGIQSIPDKLLTHAWECSPGSVETFINLAVHDRCFVKAARIRCLRDMSRTEYLDMCKRIYSISRNPVDVRKYLLLRCLTERDSSRFSTVRKNNEIDRSIDLQPFINMLVQRAIGLGLKKLVKTSFGVDLETAQHLHGLSCSKSGKDRVATIDLKNASDSVSWSLVEFLFPKWFVKLLRAACPTYVEGLDGHFYMTKKVSSMGNGFTFELMTLILLSLAREFDCNSSVYGDDITITPGVAPEFIQALQSGGFVVNDQKSFIDGPFRESCGSNYHDDFGYLRSYDFEYPETIGDCIVFVNKCYRLRRFRFFRELRSRLMRVVPSAWRGPAPLDSGETGPGRGLDDLGSYFWSEKTSDRNKEIDLQSFADDYNWTRWFIHYGFEFKPMVKTAPRRQISMLKNARLYFMYMHAGRVSPISVTGRGSWVPVAFMSNGRYSIRVKNLLTASGNS